MTAGYTTRGEQRCFEGVQGFYEHESASCGGKMRFGVFLPPAALAGRRVPVLYYLAGLTCTEETFAIKAGAQRKAAQLGLALVTCDTSPRTARFAGDDEAWDFGQGAGFYLDATQSPWSSAYRMRSYVTRELRELVEASFPLAPDQRGIFGHSMGGHGALSIALGLPGEYRSVSAFAPIVAPSQVPWGQKAFSRYLGEDRTAWAQYDTVELLERQTFAGTLRVD
jgi:S-formylglutathione hydrolase